MSKKKQIKKKRDYSRTIDLIFLLVMLLFMIAAFYISMSFKILPMKWILMASAVFALLFAILFLLTMKQLPTWAIIIKRFVILLSCVLLGFSGFYLDRTTTTIKQVAKSGTKVVIQEMKVIVPESSQITSIDELDNAVIGFQNGADADNSEYIKQQISKDVSTFQEREEGDYTTLAVELINGSIQALAISENYYKMQMSNMEGFKDNVKTIKTYQRQVNPMKGSDKDITKETFTVYLSGLDNMGSPDQITRTDTNLILIVNPKAKHINMVSLPRDGYMPNTAFDNANDKLTHTGNSGVETSVATIQQFFQIPIDFYARVSFNSLIEIIDTIGGIDVDVELDFCEQNEDRSFEENDMICLNKGKQHLNGEQALAYARHRKTAGYDNPGRERAQQRIIKAIINKMISASALNYLNSLLEIIPNYVITNVSGEQIADFISSELDNMGSWNISSISSDNGVYDDQVAYSTSDMGVSNCYLFNQDEVHAVVNAYDGASNQLNMKEFNFDLNNLYKNTPAINDDPNIVWDTMAGNPN